jgi:hypothetical protein
MNEERDTDARLWHRAPHQPRSTRDAPYALERGGVASRSRPSSRRRSRSGIRFGARGEEGVRRLGLLYAALSSHRRGLSVSGHSCYL